MNKPLLTRPLVILFAFLLSFAFLPGCGVVKIIDENADSAELVVTYATMKVISGSSDPESRAARVVAVVDVALAVASDNEALVDAIADAVKAEIDWDSLDPPDRFIVSRLIDTVKEDISAKVGAGQIDGAGLLSVKTVLGWVKTAAENAV